MTRAEWEQRDASEPYGGDFWNTAQVYRAAFADPQVMACTPAFPLRTGLCQVVYVRLSDGRAHSLTLMA